ncbi:MAG TPA: pantetheine-phosphate adenylyltransferase [Rhodospirillaceae bacterium]|nr:pantetheine-phosphate adenylyltransferase [Rhodospirillaceae bacterium]
MTRRAIYPGTFDPITKGHLDIIRRAASVVDELIVAVAENAGKNPKFTVAERVALVQADLKLLEPEFQQKIRVENFNNLLMHYVQSREAKIIIRGLRAVSDFEYEFQMGAMNSRLNPDVQTVFLMASDKLQFISSRFVKEIAALGGDVSQFVSETVVKALQK